jgi:dTDP-4-dehydrorhamnose reductase
LIWLIGDKGMLGTEQSLLFKSRDLEYIGSDRECDITDIEALRAHSSGRKIEWIVNCSAYTAVDKAEDDEETARRINALGAGNVATLAEELGAKLMHISTDYVFSGSGNRPIREDEKIAPTSAYGRTKAEGEALVRAACSRHFIVRTAWLYGQYGGNFVATMLRLMAERGDVGVVADQRGSPTWAQHLAQAIAHIIESKAQAYGTYHFADAGDISWYEFAMEILKQGRERGILAKDATVRALTTDQYPSKAKRPMYSVLSREKIQNVLGVAVHDWKEGLRQYMDQIARKGN